MKRDLISGIFWFCCGVLLCVWSLEYQIGTLTQPGPGFLPLALGVIVALFSLVLICVTLRPSAPKGGKRGAIFVGNWGRVIATVVVMLVASLLFEAVGYMLTFFVLTLLLLLIAGVRSWLQIGLVSVGTTLGVYLVFVLLLKQPLPTGLLGV